MLDAEAARLSNAERCERPEVRKDPCAGSYERALDTNAGQVKLGTAGQLVAEGISETLECTGFPSEHWRHIRASLW